MLIYENSAIRAINPSTLKTIFTTYDPELYIPLTFFTYQIDYLVGGINPLPYHMQNLLWHTLNALLVTWLMLLLLKNRWVAVMLGLLFAVHPLHTEAVVWASARKDVLSTFFFLLSVIEYIRYRKEGKSRFHYGMSLCAFLLGLFAKVTILTLPVVLLLLDLLAGRKWSRTMIIEKIPFFALSGIFAVVAFYGKTGVLGASTILEKLLMAPVSTMHYLSKIVAPAGLSVLYPFFGDLTLSNPVVLLAFCLTALFLAIVMIALRYHRVAFFALAFFLVTLSPTLFNFAKGDTFYFASDRYAYVPSVGVLLLIGLIILWLGKISAHRVNHSFQTSLPTIRSRTWHSTIWGMS